MTDDGFFNNDEKNKLLNAIINTNYTDEDEVWDLSLELEHYSIVLRRNVLEQDND